MMVEAIVTPAEVSGVLPNILSGGTYKYVVDFSEDSIVMSRYLASSPMNETKQTLAIRPTNANDVIAMPSETLRAAAQHKIDFKTKPLGALGVLESLAVQMALVQDSLSPVIKQKALFVFAADHGIAEEGVSAFPQEVTRQMVLNFLAGGAAINVLCRHNAIAISIVDIGVKGDPFNKNGLIEKRVAGGTCNFSRTTAMSREQAEAAIAIGKEVFLNKQSKEKIDIIGLGEMGIANTTAATAIICAVTGLTPAQCAGRGTGIDGKGLQHKIDVLEKALRFHAPSSKDPLEILQTVGGFEIAGMAGAALAAASNRCAVVLDGLISTAAGLIAYLIDPRCAHYFVSGHKSVEVGQKAALDYMGLKPVLDLGMRLGEGTGAALTINLVEAACRIMGEMASFEEAGVSGRDE